MEQDTDSEESLTERSPGQSKEIIRSEKYKGLLVPYTEVTNFLEILTKVTIVFKMKEDFTSFVDVYDGLEISVPKNSNIKDFVLDYYTNKYSKDTQGLTPPKVEDYIEKYMDEYVKFALLHKTQSLVNEKGETIYTVQLPRISKNKIVGTNKQLLYWTQKSTMDVIAKHMEEVKPLPAIATILSSKPEKVVGKLSNPSEKTDDSALAAFKSPLESGGDKNILLSDEKSLNDEPATMLVENTMKGSEESKKNTDTPTETIDEEMDADSEDPSKEKSSAFIPRFASTPFPEKSQNKRKHVPPSNYTYTNNDSEIITQPTTSKTSSADIRKQCHTNNLTDDSIYILYTRNYQQILKRCTSIVHLFESQKSKVVSMGIDDKGPYLRHPFYDTLKRMDNLSKDMQERLERSTVTLQGKENKSLDGNESKKIKTKKDEWSELR